MTRKRPGLVGLLLWALTGAAVGALAGLLFTTNSPELRLRGISISAVMGTIAAAIAWEFLYNRDHLADS